MEEKRAVLNITCTFDLFGGWAEVFESRISIVCFLYRDVQVPNELVGTLVSVGSSPTSHDQHECH